MRVELVDLRRRFGRLEALAGVTLAIEPGTRWALVGPNGSGKSTLIRVLIGMLAYQGQARVDGRCPFRERVALMQRMAYVPQVAPRLAVTVREITQAVATLRRLEPQRIRAAAGELALDLEAIARQELRNLSGGMRQKLLIALGLASGAELVVLDEPTASLDPSSRERFFNLIERLDPRPTVLLCSHRLEEIRRVVDQVAVLEEGRVAHIGDAQEFMRRTRQSVLEVRAAGADAGAWLAARGFRAGQSGWWSRPMHNGERVELLGALTNALAGRIEDIVVRDAERISGKEAVD